MDVLVPEEKGTQAYTDGIIEDDSDEHSKGVNDGAAEIAKRWTRICRCAGSLGRYVDGFAWDRQSRAWLLGPSLTDKVHRWTEEQRETRERRAPRWEDDMEVDEATSDDSESSSDDPDDDDHVKALRARRRYLRSLIQSGRTSSISSPRRSRVSNGISRRAHLRLRVISGYSVLVMDTNILLSSLAMFTSLVQSLRWTIIVPLAVVTELDGLCSNTSALGAAAKAALDFVAGHIRSHGTSLKVQTSKGNYLSSLTVRSEQIQLGNRGSWERNMDDLILRVALWQLEHWHDRSSLLEQYRDSADNDFAGASRVVLLSFDRNLRLKARSRQLDAADEKDMAVVLAHGGT